MASQKKTAVPAVQEPIEVPVTSQLYLQEVFNRTEMERQTALGRVRSELNVPDEMAYAPQPGVFMVPPSPDGPKLVPDASD